MKKLFCIAFVGLGIAAALPTGCLGNARSAPIHAAASHAEVAPGT